MMKNHNLTQKCLPSKCLSALTLNNGLFPWRKSCNLMTTPAAWTSFLLRASQKINFICFQWNIKLCNETWFARWANRRDSSMTRNWFSVEWRSVHFVMFKFPFLRLILFYQILLSQETLGQRVDFSRAGQQLSMKYSDIDIYLGLNEVWWDNIPITSTIHGGILITY